MLDVIEKLGKKIQEKLSKIYSKNKRFLKSEIVGEEKLYLNHELINILKNEPFLFAEFIRR